MPYDAFCSISKLKKDLVTRIHDTGYIPTLTSDYGATMTLLRSEWIHIGSLDLNMLVKIQDMHLTKINSPRTPKAIAKVSRYIVDVIQQYFDHPEVWKV